MPDLLTLPEGWDENPAVAAELLETLRTVEAERTAKTKGTLSFESPGALAQAIDPTTVQTPALELIDRALVDVVEGRTNRLIISMPPQEGKSERTSHYGALWMMQRNPDLRLAIISYADDIAGRISYSIRGDIETYTGIDDTLNLGMRLQRDSKAASEWRLARPHRGGVIARGIGSSLTGRPVDVMFIDDPVKDFRSADSEKLSEDAWLWWGSVARTRLHPRAPVILILTRWSENDLAGRLLAKQKADEAAGLSSDHWTVVNIPAQADHDPEKGETDPLGREPGEFMLSARGRTQDDWERTKAATAARIWVSLYQGRPSPDSGDVWQRAWWGRYRTPLHSETTNGAGQLVCRVTEADEVFQSWDLAFKDKRSSDFVVGQTWARRGPDTFLLEQVRRRMSFTDSLTAVTAMRTRWPQTRAVLIEDKANGPAVIDTLRSKIPGLVPVTPHESKYARATAVSPFIRAHNVHLPEGVATVVGETNAEELIEEAAAFPNGAHDDQVDATSQALAYVYLDGAGGAAWLEWIKGQLAKQRGETVAQVEAEIDGDPEVATEPERELTDAEKLRAARDARVRD